MALFSHTCRAALLYGRLGNRYGHSTRVSSGLLACSLTHSCIYGLSTSNSISKSMSDRAARSPPNTSSPSAGPQSLASTPTSVAGSSVVVVTTIRRGSLARRTELEYARRINEGRAAAETVVTELGLASDQQLSPYVGMILGSMVFASHVLHRYESFAQPAAAAAFRRGVRQVLPFAL